MKNGKINREKGGHELVNVVIDKHPYESNLLVAAFRFGTETSLEPFRFRYYQFEEDITNEYDAILTLYRPTKAIEQLLKENRYDLRVFCPLSKDLEKLEKCQVGWKRKFSWKKFQFYYFGELVAGECQLVSQKDPNMMSTSKDELYIFQQELWINDRVYAPDGTLLIGNLENIPYMFDKFS
jgi:hypothetical protein